MRLKKLLVLLGGISLTLSANVANVTDLTHTVERSRVLSMRIIKSHALIATHNAFQHPEKKLEEDYRALKRICMMSRCISRNTPKRSIPPSHR